MFLKVGLLFFDSLNDPSCCFLSMNKGFFLFLKKVLCFFDRKNELFVKEHRQFLYVLSLPDERLDFYN